MSQRSTRETEESAALRVIADWMKNGLPDPHGRAYPISRTYNLDEILYSIKMTDLDAIDARKIVTALEHRGLIDSIPDESRSNKESPLFIPWLYTMWDFYESPRIHEIKSHGQRISSRRCDDMTGNVRKHWEPAFPGKYIHEITKSELKAFGLGLAEKGELASKTINNIMSAGTAPLRWASNNDLIDHDPTKGLKKFAGAKRKRGILSETEAKEILSMPWDEERARIGNLLASQMGLRAGEILGLRIQDLGRKKLHVRHSWSAVEGLKGTKTGDIRNLLWAPGMRKELMMLAKDNPHGLGPDMFVFYSTLPDRPMDNHELLDNFKEQFVRLKAKNDSKEERKKAEKLRIDRNIVVHSWRHYTAAQLKSRGVPRNIAMDYMGHGSVEVFEAYADHETEQGDEVLASSMGWSR